MTFTGFDSNGSVKESSSKTIDGFNFTPRETGPIFKESFVGWVKVTATQPVIIRESLENNVGCRDPNSEFSTYDLRSRLQLAPAVGTRRKFVEVRFDNTIHGNTGISIVFPSKVSNSVAKGKLVFRWIDGRTVVEKDVTIPANGQVIRYFTELLREALRFSQFALAHGSLELTFDQEVFITAIQFKPTIELLEEDLIEPLSGTF